MTSQISHSKTTQILQNGFIAAHPSLHWVYFYLHICNVVTSQRFLVLSWPKESASHRLSCTHPFVRLLSSTSCGGRKMLQAPISDGLLPFTVVIFYEVTFDEFPAHKSISAAVQIPPLFPIRNCPVPIRSETDERLTLTRENEKKKN